MLTDAQSLRDMPLPRRIGVLLSCADIANRSIMLSHPKTFEVCKEAIQKCRDWLEGQNITPEALAMYLDADEAENPWMQESQFRNDTDGLNALVLITMVIGYVAHFAYLHVGKAEKMSEIIAEAGESILVPIVDYGERYWRQERYGAI